MDNTFMKEKPVLPLLLSMALPMVISMLVNSLYNIVDSLFVAKISDSAMTALSLVFPVQNFINAAGIGFGVGINAVIAFYSGAGDKERADRGVLLAAIHGVILTVVSILIMPPFLEAFTNDQEVIQLGLQYSNVAFLFSVVINLGMAFEKIFQAVGSMKTSMVSLLCGCIVNIILDPMMIFGWGFPEMGIAGAAIASSISEGVSALFYILYTRYRTDWRRYKFRFTGFDFSLLKQILSLSVWVMIQQGVAFLAWFLFFLCIEHLGKRDLAATNIVRAVSSLIFMFINAFASTTSSLVSNLIGAGYTEQIMPLCRKMIRLCFCFVLPLCILAAAIPYWTLRIYTDDVSLIEYAIPSLWVMLTTNIPCTAAFIYQFSVSGTGNTRTALTIVACTSIVYVAYTALLVYGLHADVALCWTADHVYYGCTLTASYLYMRYGNWRARKI